MTETTAKASRIGRFTLNHRLGRSSIATVYHAHDSRDNRDVVIKLIHSQIDSSAALQAIREQQLDQVQHPAICRLCSVDQYQGLSYLAYEYADGVSLAELLAAKRLRGRDKLPLMRALVEGLAALHEHGICHLCVTPDRIKVTADKTPKILGIGRSSLLEAACESTGIKRTELRYMAPEQLDSGTCDERTDVFRLSLVLFEILSRKPTLNPASTKDAREQLRTFALAPDALGPSRAAVKLMEFLNKGLATDPEQRYRNAIEMLAAMPKVRAKNRSSAQDQVAPTGTASPKAKGELSGETKTAAERQSDNEDENSHGKAAEPLTPAGDREVARQADPETSTEAAGAADTDTGDHSQNNSEGNSDNDGQSQSDNDSDSDNHEDVVAADSGSEESGETDGESVDTDQQDTPVQSEQPASAETSESEAGDGEKTLAYVLDRLANSNDFPTLSQSVFEVNELTSLQANATVSQIAEVILRDYALSNELLKLANSAYYGVRVEVTRVSDAIRLLGFEQVRITANGLAYTAKIGPGMEQLRDAMLKSFASGLVARELAEDVRIDDSEEAFLCAMFHDTGEHLTIHYLPDEHMRVVELLKSGQAQNKTEATTRVLGLTFASLGAAVARNWRFPEKIVTAIEGETADGEPLDDPQLLQLSWVARGANDLCELACQYSPDDADPALQALLERLKEHLRLDITHLQKALHETAEKIQAYAPVLGIDANSSEYMQAFAKWGPAPAEDSPAAAPDTDGDTDADTTPDADTHIDNVNEAADGQHDDMRRETVS